MKFDLAQTFQIGILYQENLIFLIIARVQRHSRTSLRNRYLNGPPFLYESLESVLKFGDIKEEEKDQVENNHMNTYQPTKVTSTFPWEHCSSFTKLIQHIALMKLFVRKWIFKTQSCMKLKLTASLLQESRTAIFELVQRENFASELKYLQVSDVVSNQNKLLQLNPILDKSLIKVGGRLKHATIPNHTSGKAPGHIPYYSSELLDSKWKVDCKKDFTKVFTLRANTSSAMATNTGRFTS